MLLKQKNVKSGFAIGRPSASSKPRTFVVLGVPRGGTSFVAGALRLAGVFMGDEVDPANNEDRAFNFHGGNFSALTSPGRKEEYLAIIRKTIHTRNSTHLVWGWKDPLSALYIDDILPDLVNPHFIFVTRDTTAAVMRERIEISGSMGKDSETDLYLDKTWNALKLYQASVAAIARARAPTFFVSYEKAIRNKEDFALQLLRFVTGTNAYSSKHKSVLKEITIYTREGAVSADLLIRRTPDETPSSSIDLSKFSDLPELYQQCANLINLRHYEDGLSLIERVLAQIILGLEPYPNLRSDPVLVAEIEAGMWFMAAIAMVNLGDGSRSYQALARFSAVAQFLSIVGQKSDLIDGIKNEAAVLFRRLEQELRG